MAEEEDPVRVTVDGVAWSPTGPAVLLVPKEERVVLPIYVDQGQAANIEMALQREVTLPRPMTHDLFSTVLHELGAIVEKVVVDDLLKGTFYASLYILVERDGKEERRRFDARPSDAIALALRCGAPIYVARKVLKEAGTSLEDQDTGVSR